MVFLVEACGIGLMVEGVYDSFMNFRGILKNNKERSSA